MPEKPAYHSFNATMNILQYLMIVTIFWDYLLLHQIGIYEKYIFMASVTDISFFLLYTAFGRLKGLSCVD